ncbi:hypothetical protein N8482_03120 [Chitinophagales bacterium]|nr:hypothetical protein [Chitinophagales bacterium]
MGGLSTSDDTEAMLRGLKTEEETIDVGPAGTTMRFLTALFSTRLGDRKILTGSERMKARPIGILVDCLRELGAEINYLEKEGFPPLEIKGRELVGGKLSIPASVSSQFISALLLIAPSMSKGLELELVGKVVSWPYINMTLKILEKFGAEVHVTGNHLFVRGPLDGVDLFEVEADWSAASYHYIIASLAKQADIVLEGLSPESLQADAAIVGLAKNCGIESSWNNGKLRLQTTGVSNPFSFDFIECPDIAQSLAVMTATIPGNCRLTGLETLRIKETDRITALVNELSKYKAITQSGEDWMELDCSQANWKADEKIATYHDHRMAMSFAPLALLTKTIDIEYPIVVAKSYPAFWDDLKRLGFKLSYY